MFRQLGLRLLIGATLGAISLSNSSLKIKFCPRRCSASSFSAKNVLRSDVHRQSQFFMYICDSL